MVDDQIGRIKQKLFLLQDWDTKKQIFGAGSHNYKLEKTLSINEINFFENEHKIQLPEDYVSFLINIGNGGAGPFYGVEKLQDVLFSDLDFKDPDSLLNPSEPFTHSGPWNMVFSPTVSETENEKIYYSELDSFYEDYGGNNRLQGVIRICNLGCGHAVNLVVKGPEKGFLWTDSRISDAGIYPSVELGNTDKISFLDWYELWLDNSLASLSSEDKPKTTETSWWKFW